MAENGNAGAAGGAQNPAGGAPAGGAQPNQPPLALSVQYVKDLSFENPNAPHTFANMQPAPEISVEINVDTTALQERVFEVVLTLRASAKRQETAFFMCELSYGGVCVVGQQVPQEHVHPLVSIEGPRMLFPFARAVLSDAIRDGGFPPLLLNPIDFAQLYQQIQAQRQQAAQTGNATA